MSKQQHEKRRIAGPLGLVILASISTASCGGLGNMTRTITPNAYSASVGPEQAKADESECFTYGSAERARLLKELLAGDPSVGENQARETGAGNTARTMASLKGASTAEGDLAAGAASILFSSRDSDTQDESKLAQYLGIEGGLGDGFRATKRIRNTCLRARGYQVDEYAEDGSGTAHLVWADPDGTTRVVLREADGSERVFFEYVTQN